MVEAREVVQAARAARLVVPVALLLALSACGGGGGETPAPVCGDGILGGAEACDDHGTTPGDGCSATCAQEAGWACSGSPSACATICGDGILAGAEACDDHGTASGDGCSVSCSQELGWLCSGAPSVCGTVCGDGILAGAEACDDDNTVPGDGCSDACAREAGFTCAGAPTVCDAVCGDGLVVALESCDDGATTPGDGCSSTCSREPGWTCAGAPSACAATCGDGIVAGAEACDDANLQPGDGCSATCSREAGWTCAGAPSTCSATCGDGLVVGTEACDDANLQPGDGCSATCSREAGWTCAGAPSACTTTCGDGIPAGTEACDDGNLGGFDGCGGDCQQEPGFACTGAPSSCTTTCGDGVMTLREACDDGNTTDGDGCSATCTPEPGWTCSGFPISPTTCGPVCGDGQVLGGEQCDDGNTTSGDGCQSDCTLTQGLPQVVTCADLVPLPSATCAATAGEAGLLVTGTVLVPGTVYRGGQVAVGAGGAITCVGCDCSAAPGAATATRLTCPTGVISPGLVNLRDLLTFAQNAPAPQTDERYEHRHDWRRGLNGHTQIPAAGNASADQQRWGELRGLMGGATSTAGSGGQAGLQRNLGATALQEGLGRAGVHVDAFPLGDSGGATLTDSCAYPAYASPAGWAGAPGAVLVVGEGISPAARNELACTTSLGGGGSILAGTTVAYAQAVGAGPLELGRLAGYGTALVWSPRSNVSLYGDTAQVAVAARLGVQIALATDWSVTGSSTMLRELACADEWNRARLRGFFTDERLWLMATRDAADAAGLLDALGVLAPGRAGDLVIFDGRTRSAHRAVLEAGPADVALVVRGGKVLYGDAALVAAGPGGACEPLDVCGTPKQACVVGETGTALAVLAAANASSPPLFACGVPPGERTCVPSRSESVSGSTIYDGIATIFDRDGDGIGDGADTCPAVFDPIRPGGGPFQPDTDFDGLGDACDPCPLAANATTCPAIDPADPDADGVPSASDNCPEVNNPDQADADADGHGDACDACPAEPNPGPQGCPVSVYGANLQQPGTRVLVRNALVTARATEGFFAQVKEGDADYVGPDFSGLWVQQAGNAVTAGQRVDVEGVMLDYFGQTQLVAGAVTAVTLASEAPPAPVAVTPAEVVLDGPRSIQLEGVLVQVGPTTVTAAGLAGNEFQVAGGLPVDDLFHLATPPPAVGQGFTSLTGVLAMRGGATKLEPRSAADLVGGAPGLLAFGPALTYARVGAPAGPTIPPRLEVTLTGPAPADAFVSVTSGDAALQIPGGGVTVPAGASLATVAVLGLTRAPAVTLTASLGATSLQATVRVLDDLLDVAAPVAIGPPFPAARPGAALALSVSFDLPVLGGRTVVLSTTGGLTCPASIGVAPDALAADFTCLAPGVEGLSTVTVDPGGANLTAEVLTQAPTHLVLNELDYDTVGADTGEFVELYNPTAAPVTLAGKALVLVNGGVLPGLAYATLPLDAGGSLAPGQFLVVCSSAVAAALPAGAKRLLFTDLGWLDTNAIQNGPQDGVALVDTLAGTLDDAIGYEASTTGITGVEIPGVGVVSLVEGTPLPAGVADGNTAPGSLGRPPSGSDTDDAATDWHFSPTPSPGAANQ